MTAVGMPIVIDALDAVIPKVRRGGTLFPILFRRLERAFVVIVVGVASSSMPLGWAGTHSGPNWWLYILISHDQQIAFHEGHHLGEIMVTRLPSAAILAGGSIRG